MSERDDYDEPNPTPEYLPKPWELAVIGLGTVHVPALTLALFWLTKPLWRD